MNRRGLLTAGLGMAATVIAGSRFAMADLEPDGKWLIYRRYALFIVGRRDDAAAGAVAGLLARVLPQSRARLARAANARRIGVLIGTNQQDVAVMETGDAEALFLAEAPFADIRDLPLRVMVSFGKQVLVCRSDFPARYGFLLAQALVGNEEALPMPPHAPESLVPVHPGSRAFFAGERMPA
jgi:hypothetical protein